jgi:hypothetical protein
LVHCEDDDFMQKPILTIIVAALAAVVGTWLVSHQLNPAKGGDRVSMDLIWVILPASIIFWSYAGYLIRRFHGGILSTLLLGAVSPFVGGFLAGLPYYGFGALYGVLLAVIDFQITIPVGIATGLAVWLVNRDGEQSQPHLN